MLVPDDVPAAPPTPAAPRISARAPADPHERAQLLADYRLACVSRQTSVVGRREVLSGNAKFGIFGDGKELPQIALARAMRPGDWRSGYYRDQTLMMALGLLTPRQLFAQLYGEPDVSAEPASGGRAMVSHFATRLLDADGRWLPQTRHPNSSADISPTAGQMPRLVGLAHASLLYRDLPALRALAGFSQAGQEVAFGTIGNASCAEGLFWEAINAIGVLSAPAVISIWDDGYGISVPNELQLAGGDLSRLLEGFRRPPGGATGFALVRVCGWDYPALCAAYARAAADARERQIPTIVHVTELPQPLGHSTSGSQERYKSPERLAWEAERDPLRVLRAWLLDERVADEAELAACESACAEEVERARASAAGEVLGQVRAESEELCALIEQLPAAAPLAQALRASAHPLRRDVAAAAHAALVATLRAPAEQRAPLLRWQRGYLERTRRRYGSHLLSETDESPLLAEAAPPLYAPDAPEVRGFEVLRAAFERALARDPRVLLFGEDVGRLGDVNQGAAGLQEQFGALRVADTGIREATIIGQAIGLALRGLRPIAEIQYVDYILYALTALSDDLATLRWRTAGGQKAPVIVRTRGHRLEGVWHSGSPIGTLLGSLRGMHLLAPRDMTRAAGMYNALLRGDDPALVIEPLNGYRLRERMPANLGDLVVPPGVPETLRPGDDLTLVTYGSCCRIALEAAERLSALAIEVEVIDAQSLMPFDRGGMICESLARTARLLVLDEDLPGGASAYILREVLERQGGYWQLDSPPRTVTAQPHRPAYGSDGDYFSKPNADDVVAAAYELLREADPARYPELGAAW